MTTADTNDSTQPVGLSAMTDSTFARTLFVWAKGGRIRCFSPDEIRFSEEGLRAKGWRHTATLDPARWIEAMANGNTASDMLDELQMGQNDKSDSR